MKTKTNSKATETKTMKIEEVCKSRYGADAMECDAVAIEWAANHIAERSDMARGMREWKRINRKRERMGRYTTIPQWGTPQWAAYFAK